VDLGNGDCGVYGLFEGVLEEFGVSHVYDAFIVRVELYVNDGFGGGS
jgi:hypothetical protein